MFIQILSYCLPAVIVAVMAYFFFLLYFKNEDKKRRWHLIKDLQKEALPLRLQAYERLVLLLDRTSPQKLALRVAPASSDKQAYELLQELRLDLETKKNQIEEL